MHGRIGINTRSPTLMLLTAMVRRPCNALTDWNHHTVSYIDPRCGNHVREIYLLKSATREGATVVAARLRCHVLLVDGDV